MFLFVLLASLNMVMAKEGLVNVTSPTDDANHTSFTVTCTYSNDTDSVMIPLSANTTFSQDGTAFAVTGFSCTATSCSASASASALTDGLTQNISCIIGNNTVTSGSDNNATNIDIYSSTPSCSFTLDRANVEYMDGIGVETTQGSTKDALTTLTYNWILFDAGGLVQDQFNSSAPTFSLEDFDEIGEATLSLIATDGWQNANTCTNQTISVFGSNGDAGVIAPAVTSITTGSSSNSTIIIILIIVGAGVFIGAGFWVISSAKK